MVFFSLHCWLLLKMEVTQVNNLFEIALLGAVGAGILQLMVVGFEFAGEQLALAEEPNGTQEQDAGKHSEADHEIILGSGFDINIPYTCWYPILDDEWDEIGK